MIGHKLPNKNKKCYSSRTQTFSPTKQPHVACPFDDPLSFFRAWVLFILFVSLLLLACAVGFGRA
jgi:hypothetical protein